MISFNTMLKSTTLGLKTYQYALNFAAKTPFETPNVINATKQFLGFGFSLKQIPTMMNAVGDASSALSLGEDGLMRLGTIFGQIKSKGRLQGDELLQLDEAKLGVRDALKNAYKGMNFQKLLEGGKIGANDALSIIISSIQKRFGGMMNKQSKSLFGLVSTLKSRPFELFQNLDADKELKPVKNVLNNLVALSDFENNPVGKKVKTRFISSMNTLFGTVFGSLAKSTDPDAVGKSLDKVFDKLDSTMAWFKKEGPGILSSAKSFFGVLARQ